MLPLWANVRVVTGTMRHAVGHVEGGKVATDYDFEPAARVSLESDGDGGYLLVRHDAAGKAKRAALDEYQIEAADWRSSPDGVAGK